MAQDETIDSLQPLLEQGCDKLEFNSSDTSALFLQYIELLLKWNKTYNLTAIKEPEAILNRHVLDSLSALRFIEGQHCLDIGTGPGLPGLILAIALPESQWTLLDSNQKKIRFLRHVKAELGLSNVDVVHTRVESYKPVNDFDTVICRAFAPLNRLLELSEHLITQNNQLLAMKGKQVKGEIDELENHQFLIQRHDLESTTDSAHASLLQIRRAE